MKNNRPLRVLHLIEALGSGGAERLLHTNLQNLDSTVVESEVVTVFPQPTYWKDPIEKLGVKVSNLGCTGHLDIPRGIARLRRHLAERRPDLIHTHLFAANIIGRIAGRMKGIPVVSSIHNPEYESAALESVGSTAKIKITAGRWLDIVTAFAGCTKMIGVSEFVSESGAKHLFFPADKIDVIYNPITSLDQKPLTDRKAVLEKLGLPADARLLLNVARIGRQKGLLTAVRAMASIVEAEPRAHLLSVGVEGDAEYVKQVRNAVAELGLVERVRFLGQRSDVPDLLAACDVFIFPSLFEGLGIALAEALAAGCACVVSKIRPFDEFLIDGVNAVVVPPGDADAFANATISLLRDDDARARLGAAAHETAVKMFSPGPAARKLEAMYSATARVDAS